MSNDVKNLRTPAVLIFVLYSALVVGMNFHFHTKDQNVSVHCKICDFSQTFASQPSQVQMAVDVDTVGTVPALSIVFRHSDPVRGISGRSPPLS